MPKEGMTRSIQQGQRSQGAHFLTRPCSTKEPASASSEVQLRPEPMETPLAWRSASLKGAHSASCTSLAEQPLLISNCIT